MSWQCCAGVSRQRSPKDRQLINFRSEDRSFPVARCLVPASHFFEITGKQIVSSSSRTSTPSGACIPCSSTEPPRSEEASRGHRLPRRENDKSIGAGTFWQIMRVDRVRHRFETEKVRVAGGRVEDVGREQRVGHNIERELLIGP